VICNNAGVSGPGGPLWTLSEADWDWTLSIDLTAVVRGIRLFLPALLASGEEGHVVNTASMAGLTSTPMLGPYTVAKHGVVALSEVLAKDLELTGAKVGVSVLCPGFVQTQIGHSARNRPADSRAAASPASSAASGFAEVIHQLVATGLSPDVVADRVVAAIREPRFYILTHPEMKGAIAHRMKEILDERQPGIDPGFRALLQMKVVNK
jgi:NAD(P)-dependent dehydrogenase (short-subunit alcohol dehydrogenase family)